MSQDQRIHLGYTVSPCPLAVVRRYLTYLGTGHQWWWQLEDGADLEKRLLKEYGNVVRWNASLGVCFSTGNKVLCSLQADHILQEERLWIADPKAIHYILQGTNYLYQKPRHFMELLEAVIDKGIASVDGELPPYLM